ncbi:MAG: Sec-independent protein translocase protein TatA [Mitsuokella multacida]|jgi:sec-independent protein translocase protein TatA
MLMGLTVPKLLLIFAIGLLVFGPGKLPLVGKSLGKSVREFKSAVTEDEKAEPKQLAQSDSKTGTVTK